ncbi:MAG: DnaA regulatory inactivator Hda [Gammaproteobacteria bacterium]|nr:DnaA regulatory inactivator Hda [Gammaproteobacteria bacterium]
MEQLPLSVRLRDSARLASFVPGRNRELLRLIGGGPAAGPRVVWIWGRPGTGKTHLLQAACAAVADSGGTASYLDLTATADPAWLEGCESLDLVCLDGIDAIAGNAAWNEAIFRLHALMQDYPARLYAATTAPPAAIEFHLPDLRSRLLAASVHQLFELDEADQAEALRRRAAQRGLELSTEGALYLVHRLPRDMHSLCAMLDRLDEASLAAQRRLTVPFLRSALEAQGFGSA